MPATPYTTERLLILETLNRYAWAYDTRDLGALAECFTSDGAMLVALAGTDGWGPYEGREAIVDWMAGVMHSQTDQRRHSIGNVVFRKLDAQRARVDSFLTLTAVENGAARLVCTGTYHDEMVNDQGTWRIQHKLLRLDNAF